jgi:ferrochelatase
VQALAARKAGISYRILFSAHGLPKYIVERGDPYAWQVRRSAEAIVARLGSEKLDWRICYQSRVGPLKWLEPATDAEIRLAGMEAKGLIVVPIAFVSEHSETLVELDIEYGKLARESGVVDYIRVPTVSVQSAFIEGLAALVMKAAAGDGPATCGGGRLCPAETSRCGYGRGTR